MKKDQPDHESLRNENEILKIKLMLEHGADFSNGLDGIDPHLENQFLKNIDAFEKQFSNCKRVTVFEKIGSPVQFKSVDAIAEKDITIAWEELLGHMNKYQVTLDVCSPNVKAKELYRFVTEELFKEEMDDIDIHGMTCSFIYDEFYPDHFYENTRVAVENCMENIFSKKGLEWVHDFRDSGLQLNKHPQLSIQELCKKINNFQSAYNAIDILKLKEYNCSIEGACCRVNGFYKINTLLEKELIILEGSWMVQFEADEKSGIWYIINIQISGLYF